MAWARNGDTGATYPALMKVAGMTGADHRSVNEVAGFFWRLTNMSAAHTTDYVVDAGTVSMIAGPNERQLLRLATRAGLLTKIKADGLVAYKLLDDPDFVHIRLAAELAWEKQQRNDTRNPHLTVPIRHRDGDTCRYCGVPVVWRGRTSARSATFDHLNPGSPATIDTMVVACKSCNSELRDMGGEERESLKPAPAQPLYSAYTAKWLTDNGRPTKATEAVRPDSQSDTAATQHPAPTEDLRPDSQSEHARRAVSDPAEAGHRTAPRPTANSPDELHLNRISHTDGMHSAGSGRVGSSSPAVQVSHARKRKRSPRAGRPATL